VGTSACVLWTWGHCEWADSLCTNYLPTSFNLIPSTPENKWSTLLPIFGKHKFRERVSPSPVFESSFQKFGEKSFNFEFVHSMHFWSMYSVIKPTEFKIYIDSTDKSLWYFGKNIPSSGILYSIIKTSYRWWNNISANLSILFHFIPWGRYIFTGKFRSRVSAIYMHMIYCVLLV
jgi:hypothetical protein